MSDRNEELRAEVLTFLALRQATSHRVDTICRRLNQDGQGDYTEAEVKTALNFLEDLGYAKFERAPMGATIYWQATSKGVLQHERS